MFCCVLAFYGTGVIVLNENEYSSTQTPGDFLLPVCSLFAPWMC